MDRSVLAFAFLAQVSVGSTDLLSGLAPIFKPIAKANVGKRFDASDFAEEAGRTFGLKINPWAVEDFAPRLERAGVLQKVEIPAGAHYYVYAPVQEEFQTVSEADVQSLAAKFSAFAKPILQAHGITLTEEALARMLREQLVDLDFLAILIKPESREKPQESPTLLKRTQAKADEHSRESVEQKARQDVLCAAFILHVYRNDPEVYKLLVRIASGALLAEVILEFQEPKFTGRLDTLTVFLDAPFLMSLLDVSSEESHQFALSVCDELQAHGVTLATFQHCVDELLDNLRAVKSAFASGHARGATGRRLASPVFTATCNAILSGPELRLKALNVRVLDGKNLGSRYQFFTEEDESSLDGALGWYWNEIARKRDAASVAAVMRYRRGGRARMAEFGNAGYVFVTQNPRVVETARRYCIRRDLLDANEVPPALTDRYLAGLLWVLFGGKAGDLAPTLLLANCAAALEPRNDVIGKMHRFLSQVSERQATTFRALMTNERAGQHLMELTLGDPGFLTEENSEVLLERIKQTLVEEERVQSERRLTEEIRVQEERRIQEYEEHKRRLRVAEANVEELKGSMLDLEAKSLVADSESKDLRARLDSASERAEQERILRLDQRRRVIQSVVVDLLAARRRFYILMAITVAAVTALISYVSLIATESQLVRIGITAGTSMVAGVGFWKAPEFLFEPMLKKRLKRKLTKRLAKLQIVGWEDDFQIDLDLGMAIVRHDGRQQREGGSDR